MATPHDDLFRAIFAQPAHTRALLTGLLPGTIATAFDWATLEPVPGTFLDEASRAQHVDLLFRIQAGPRPLLLYLLLEHKSAIDRFAPLQLLGYVVQIWRAHRTEHGDRELPAVLPIVVHHGPKPWDGPTSIEELLGIGDVDPTVRTVIEESTPRFRFALVDLARCSESDLVSAVAEPVTRLVLLFFRFIRGAADEQALAAIARWRDALVLAWAGRAGDDFFSLLWSYFLQVTDVPAERLRRVVANLVDECTSEVIMSTADKLRAEGRSLGRVEGRVEGRAEVLLRQLAARFPPLPEAVQLRVRSASIDDLERWALRILDAQSLESVFATD